MGKPFCTCTLALSLIMVGCIAEEQTALVPNGPFSNPSVTQRPGRASYSGASAEAATRVGVVGQKIITANPQLGLRPVFRTIGTTDAEIFHSGSTEVCITEGLAKQCATDGQLAAVLSVELGKIIAERAQTAVPAKRPDDRLPPIDMRIGNDVGGSVGAADMTRLKELADFEKSRGPAGISAPLNPQDLARKYLTKAGYPAGEVDAVGPLLKAAAENMSVEKLLNAAPPLPDYASQKTKSSQLTPER
jgi:hypothetical protein